MLLEDRGIFSFVLANVIIDTACCMCLLAVHCIISGAFLSFYHDDCNIIRFQYCNIILYFTNKLGDSDIILSRFIYRLCQQNYCLSSLSTCVEAQQNAWPGNCFVKCADGYKFRRKCILLAFSDDAHRSCVNFLSCVFALDMACTVGLRKQHRNPSTTAKAVWTFSIDVSCTRIYVWDAATCCGTLNYKLDEPTSFFFRLSILFLSSRLPCLVVSLSACPHVPAKE